MDITFAPWSTWQHAARMHLRKNLPRIVGKDKLTALNIHDTLCACFGGFKNMSLDNPSYRALCYDIFKEYAENGAVDSWKFIKTNA